MVTGEYPCPAKHIPLLAKLTKTASLIRVKRGGQPARLPQRPNPSRVLITRRAICMTQLTQSLLLLLLPLATQIWQTRLRMSQIEVVESKSMPLLVGAIRVAVVSGAVRVRWVGREARARGGQWPELGRITEIPWPGPLAFPTLFARCLVLTPDAKQIRDTK